jgi:hypothetical protein
LEFEDKRWSCVAVLYRSAVWVRTVSVIKIVSEVRVSYSAEYSGEEHTFDPIVQWVNDDLNGDIDNNCDQDSNDICRLGGFCSRSNWTVCGIDGDRICRDMAHRAVRDVRVT